MKANNMIKRGWGFRLGLFMLFLACGLLVFFVSITFSPKIPTNIEIIVRIGLSALFLAVAIFLRRNERLKKYWQISYAFFIAAFVQFLSWYFSGRVEHFLNLQVSTVEGIAVAKLTQSLLIVIPLIVLIRIAGGDMGSIYLKKGRLKLGLIIGLLTFSTFAVITVLIATGQNIGLDRLISVTHWMLIFVLANGFMEELLFRGLFLRKFEPFLGATASNLLTAIVFTLAHMQVGYVAATDIIKFLAIVFSLSLAFGYVMQKTDSLWGSALFHAGSDLLIFSGIFLWQPS